MPKIIDYASRFDRIREAVYEITLQDGVASITLPAVAARLSMSESTLRRLMASAVDLPELGFQWAERRARTSLLAHRHTWFANDNPHAEAANHLVALVPVSDTARPIVQAGRLLTLGFAQMEWAQVATRTAQLHLASTVDRVVPEGLAEVDRGYETARLTALALGMTEAVCTGAVLPAEAERTVVQHLTSTFPAWLSERGRGAA